MHRDRIADMQLRGSTRPLPVRVYWPGQSTRGPAPLLVFCMAGAGAEAWCRGLSSNPGLVVLSVGSDAASGHDGTDVLEWAAEHAAELGGDPGRLLVAGERAGAAVAAAVALEVRDQGWPPLTRQVLINAGPIPWLPVAGIAAASVVTVADDPRADGGRYAERLRQAGVAVEELCCITSDLGTGRMLTDLGQALGRWIAVSADESSRPATSSPRQL
jgi:hypothetical protein